MLGRRAEAAL